MNIKQYNKKNENLFLNFQKIIKKNSIKKFWINTEKKEIRTVCPFCGGGERQKNKKKPNYPFRISKEMAFCYSCKKYGDPFEIDFVFSKEKTKSDFLKKMSPIKKIQNKSENFKKLDLKKYQKYEK